MLLYINVIFYNAFTFVPQPSTRFIFLPFLLKVWAPVSNHVNANSALEVTNGCRSLFPEEVVEQKEEAAPSSAPSAAPSAANNSSGRRNPPGGKSSLILG